MDVESSLPGSSATTNPDMVTMRFNVFMTLMCAEHAMPLTA